MYRDASNYKQFGEAVVSGEYTADEKSAIMGCLDDVTDGGFIPQQVDLPALQERMTGFPSEDDHCWHDLEEIELTNEEPTLQMTIRELVKKFEEAKEVGWDDLTYAL
jgi:hypothetical protein